MIQLKQEPTILLADDSPDNLRVMMDILKQTDLQARLIAAPNGKILLDIALQKVPDLIITDWEMPVMSGLEAIVELKKNPHTRDIPVIMCTGIMTTPHDLKNSMDAGAVDYVRKPIEAMELVARVQSMLRLSASYLKIKEQKEHIEHQAREMEQLNHIKDKMFSIIAHDLRSPFNSLKGMLNLLEIDPLFPDELKNIGKGIQKKVEVVDDTLNNLLTWAMTQLQGEIHEQVHIAVKPIIEGKKELFRNAAEQKNITLDADCADDVYVWADINHLRAILRNLISNALKFTHQEGKVYVRVHTNNKTTTIAVQDTGVGMSAEKTKQLFNSVTNISTQGTNKERGTGLGLLICKDFVDRNGGKIYVESQENKGTTFFVELPALAPTQP